MYTAVGYQITYQVKPFHSDTSSGLTQSFDFFARHTFFPEYILSLSLLLYISAAMNTGLRRSGLILRQVRLIYLYFPIDFYYFLFNIAFELKTEHACAVTWTCNCIYVHKLLKLQEYKYTYIYIKLFWHIYEYIFICV